MPLPRSNSYSLTLGGGRGYDVTLVIDRATMHADSGQISTALTTRSGV